MKFSIITVCLNSGDRLLQTVRSVCEQTYQDVEMIIQDGGSTDGSVETVRRMAEDRLRIYTEKDSGIYDAMNKAVSKATGEYVFFLNAGDLFYSENTLEQMASYMTDDAVIYYGDIYDTLRATVIPSNRKLDDFGYFRNVPCHQCCIYSRALFEERGYDLSYRVRADYEHFLRSHYVNGAEPRYIPVTIARYEGAGFSETAENRALSKQEHREILNKYMPRGKVLRFRTVMLLTLQPLRTWMAENPVFGRFYQGIKKRIYH